MTIYKTVPGEKKPDDTQPMTEVSLDTLPTEKGKPEGKGLPVPVVTSNRRRKNNCCLNLCVCVTALIVLAGGILGGIFLYKHITHKNRYVGWCGVGMYDDDLQPKNGKPQFLKEKVDIDLDKQTEKIQVPQIGGVEDVIVLHDFEVNLTAIVDVNEERCFVLPLDRSVVSPPSDFLDLMLKYMNGAYTPNVRKIRREYQVQYPKLEDLSRLGWYIQNQCFSYDTYRLVASGETQTHQPLLGGDDGHRPSWLATTKRPLLGAPDGHRPSWLGHHHDRDGHRGPHGHGMHGTRAKRNVKKDFKVAVIEGPKAVVEYSFKFE